MSFTDPMLAKLAAHSSGNYGDDELPSPIPRLVDDSGGQSPDSSTSSTESSSTSYYKCVYCLRKYKSLKKLKAHKCPGLGGGFLCRKCDDQPSFNTKKELYGHIKLKHWSKCGRCGALFATLDRLQAHIKAQHSTVTCVRCPTKSFKDRRALTAHLRIHSLPHRCKLSGCNKAFSGMVGLRAHQAARHLNTKPHSCKLAGCSSTFAWPSARRRHEKTHLGIKPHRCPQCGKQFARKASLTAHTQRLH